MRWSVPIAFVLLTLTVAMVSANASRAISIAAYQCEIKAWIGKLKIAEKRAAQGRDPGQIIDYLARKVGARQELTAAGGDRISVDQTWIRRDLAKISRSTGLAAKRQEIVSLRKRLEMLAAELDRSQRFSGRDPSQIKETLAQILASGEFRRGATANFIQRALAKLFKWLSERDFSFPRVGSRLALRVITVIVVLMVLGALVWALSRVRIRGGERIDEERPEISLEPEILDPGKLLDSAQAHALRGEYRAALRDRYLALLLQLDLRDLVRFDASKTNWEYFRELAEARPVPAAFRPFTALFDRIWYGQQPCSESDYLASSQMYDSVVAAVG